MVSLSPWPLASRDRELSAFAEVWSASACRCVVVCGPAGVGKTRLAEEFARIAAHDSVLLGRATASAVAAAMPMGAIAHLIPPRFDMADPAHGFAQVTEAFAGQPGTLLLDDLHLLDAMSAMLLRQLLDARAIALIATLRTGEPVNEYISALLNADTVDRIDLRAFTAEETETVLCAALPGAVARRTVHELHAASGGNALHLHELVLAAIEAGTLASDGELWQLADGAIRTEPLSLVELIESRVTGLDPSARAVLELLAVCGPVSLADVSAVIGSEADGADVLADLEQAGLVQVIVEQRRTRVLPTQLLYSEALLDRMPALRRRALLSAQAERVRATGARRRDDELRITTWQLAATGTADPELLANAARFARYAYDYPQTRRLLEAMPERSHTNATLIMLGEVLFQLGETDRAQQAFNDADALARGDAEVLAVTLARSFNLFWLAARDREAFAVNHAARSRIRAAAALRMLRYNEGSMLVASGDTAAGLSLLKDMEPDVHNAPDTMAWLMGAMMRALALGLTGHTEAEVELGEEQYAADRAVHDRTLFPHPATKLIQLSMAMSRYGDLNRAREVAERGHAELVTTAATPLATLWTALTLGEIESRAGHPAAARAWFAEAVALARAHHFVRPLHPALSGLAINAALLGDLDAADQAAAEAATCPPLGLYRLYEYLVPAWLAAARGRLAEACAVLAEGAGRAASAGMVTTEALLLTDLARLGGAEAVAYRLAALEKVCDGRFVPARARFAAALAADDPEQLSHVAADMATIGADLMAAEAATAAAAAYRRSGDTRSATAAIREAHIQRARCGDARTPLLLAGQATADPEPHAPINGNSLT